MRRTCDERIVLPLQRICGLAAGFVVGCHRDLCWSFCRPPPLGQLRGCLSRDFGQSDYCLHQESVEQYVCDEKA